MRANWLPLRRAVYNLAELLRRPGRGEAIPVRMARDDAVRELMEEYRKAAQEAVNQGDFRRAAYIYGILLQDDRMAASALMRAGLYHDAATIYASKLNDRASAAQAFEAAGEFDRALELFRQLSQHEPGDLLRRIGEEEAAVAEYLLAANELANESANHLAPGGCCWKKRGGPSSRSSSSRAAGSGGPRETPPSADSSWPGCTPAVAPSMRSASFSTRPMRCSRLPGTRSTATFTTKLCGSPTIRRSMRLPFWFETGRSRRRHEPSRAAWKTGARRARWCRSCWAVPNCGRRRL